MYEDAVSIESKIRYYRNNHSEARFFRYSKDLMWPSTRSFPICGAAYPVRIWLKHYKYRSPKQMQARINTRLEAIDKGSSDFVHEAKAHAKLKERLSKEGQIDKSNLSVNQLNIGNNKPLEEEWKSRIVKSSRLNFDANDGRYIVENEKMDKITMYPPFLYPIIVFLMKLLLRDKQVQEQSGGAISGTASGTS